MADDSKNATQEMIDLRHFPAEHALSIAIAHGWDPVESAKLVEEVRKLALSLAERNTAGVIA